MLVGANGIRINVSDTGGDGEPVVFLHGASCDASMWEPQIAYFARDYRCIAWEARGHGRSEFTLGPYTHEMFARDLYDVLEVLEVTRAHIVGLSLGGMTAMEFACTFPDRLWSLAVMCTLARPTDTPDAKRAEVYAESGRTGILERVVSPVTLHTRPDVFGPLRDMLEDFDPLLEERLTGAFTNMKLEGRLGQIAAPTVVIAGADDELFTPVAGHEYIAASIPGATLEVVADAAHAVNLEQPDVVNKILERHFASAAVGRVPV